MNKEKDYINTNETLVGVRVISDIDTTYTDFDGYYEINASSDTVKLKYSLISYNDEDFLIINDEINYSDYQLVKK